MENEVYERDYSSANTGQDPANRLTFKRMGELLHDIDIQKPRIVSPRGKQHYDFLLQECDGYCQLCCGKIRAVIDYQNWEAKIEMSFPSLICLVVEQKELLCNILRYAEFVSFSPAPDGTAIIVAFTIAYFERLEYDSAEESMDAMIKYMWNAAEKKCGGDPVIMEKVKKLFEEYGFGQNE